MAGAPSFLMEEQQHAMSISPTTGRLELIRRLVGEIKTSIANLVAHINNEVSDDQYLQKRMRLNSSLDSLKIMKKSLYLYL